MKNNYAKKQRQDLVATSVALSREQDKRLKALNINLSWLVRDLIRDYLLKLEREEIESAELESAELDKDKTG